MTPERPTSEPSVAELRRQQQEETSSSGVGTPGQWHGAIFGALLGGFVGGVLLLVVAVVAFADGPGIVVLPLIGVSFGGVAGLVYQGGRNPEREHELVTAAGNPDPSAAVAGNPPKDNEH